MQRDCAVTDAEIAEIVTQCLGERARLQLLGTGDATVTYDDPECGIVRIHAYSTRGRTAIALRMLAEEIPPLESLRLPPSAVRLTDRNHGLIAITGPTGSGKSTVLASMIDQINRTRSRHIITIEDPIEYRHKADQCHVSQREIGSDAPTFSDALRGALRSDPDIILVGEMRDHATMRAVLAAAETGHLVLCTMHTGTAPESVDRIIGSFEGAAQAEVRTQLAQTLIGVVCLRLVRRAGRAGRVAAAEVLLGSDAVRAAIRESKAHQLRNIIATSGSCGMQTMEAHLSKLVLQGEIDRDEAFSVTDRREDLQALDRSA